MVIIYAKFRMVVTWWGEMWGERREKQVGRGIKGASNVLVMFFLPLVGSTSTFITLFFVGLLST